MTEIDQASQAIGANVQQLTVTVTGITNIEAWHGNQRIDGDWQVEQSKDPEAPGWFASLRERPVEGR
ncbi:hypothetical protein [Chitinimonas lacunae]|uniref:Uncharacterized protein n=1 Tax=Chitinimonas lacunae TaxID=1963018 RepID=A0ABV8MXZ3_9NEIS